MWGSGMAREERVRVTDGALGWHGHGGFEGLLVPEGRPWPSLLPPASPTCSALKLLEPWAGGQQETPAGVPTPPGLTLRPGVHCPHLVPEADLGSSCSRGLD